MSFDGAWRVREYVFDAEGQVLGTVRQRRILESVGGARIRLTQHCEPDPSLNGHPMQNFAGTHVFDLELDGTRRRYLGPAVIGVGQTLGASAMWGEGIWPKFGHAFQSYAVSTPGKQLTGGRFADGSTLVAQIAGVACPESNESWPELSGPYCASDVAKRWSGTRTLVQPNGDVIDQGVIAREYDAGSWTDHIGTLARQASVQADGPNLRIEITDSTHTLTGLSRRYGWLLEHEWVHPSGRHIRGFEALDATSGHLVAIYRTFQDQQLSNVEVLQFHPEETS